MPTEAEVKHTSYDEVPYDSFPFAQSHPNRLATIATLMGMKPASLATCRVLELGCASGGNLIPMAATMPSANFIGIDASHRQIAQGVETIKRLSLDNIQLKCVDILEFESRELAEQGEAPGGSVDPFDYIICHGVYSWVPDRVQDKILQICADHLSDQGIAYVSYNTNPGWRMRGMIRDLMSYRAQFFESPEAQTQEARALLDFLAKAVPTENNPYGLLLNGELEMLQTKADHYLFHEHLEEHNEPVYFHEFAERAADKNLQYVGEADYSMMATSNFPPRVAAMVRRLASTRTHQHLDSDSEKLRVSEAADGQDTVDLIQLEQYMDFVRNRMFRQTLLCRGDVKLESNDAPERLCAMHVASSAEPTDPIEDLRSADQVVFRRSRSSLTTSDPLVKAAMLCLREAWPASIPFDDLVTGAIEKLNSGPILVEADRLAEETLRISRPLLQCYATGHVELYVDALPLTTSVSEHPVASPLARLQAENSNVVSTLAHGTTKLNDLEHRLLPLLTGQHNVESLVEELRRDVETQKLVLRDASGPVVDAERTNEILTDMVQKQLHAMAANCLIVR